MTEQQFQEARKVMKTANWMRGEITSAKGDVARWTAMEDSHRRNLKPAQADSAKRMLDKAIEKLAEIRKRFADLQLPGEDFQPTTKWIAGISSDSFKYEPSEIRPEEFDLAKEEGLTLFNTKAAAQAACDQANSL